MEESALAVDKGKANMNKSEREIKKLPKLLVHVGLICLTVLGTLIHIWHQSQVRK